MAVFDTLTAQLRLDIYQFSSGLRQASRSLRRFAANTSGTINTGVVTPLKQMNLHLKETPRIVAGIMISQTFYKTANAIADATSEVWNFANALEYAQVAYTGLFGDARLAEGFVEQLKEFSANTIYTYEETDKAARSLLAYGVPGESLMYVLNGVMAGASVSQEAGTVERLSRAIGQMYTKGRVQGEELRQLANSGIDAVGIIQEKLGLTQKQIANIREENIDAGLAINALVEGMKERYGGIMDAATLTTVGAINKVKDSAIQASEVFFSSGIKLVQNYIKRAAEFMDSLRNAGRTLGAGGIFEAIVPEHAQKAIRNVIANLANLARALRSVAEAALAVLRPAIWALINAFNAIAPIVNVIIYVLGKFISTLLSNTVVLRLLTVALTAAAAAFVVFKVQALAAVAIKALITVVLGLAKALMVLSAALFKNPILLLIAVLVGGAAALSASSAKLGNAFSKISEALQGLLGLKGSDTLIPEEQLKDGTDSLNAYNEALSDTSDTLDDVADSAGKAAKAGKSLLSFDEVFKLNDPDEADKSSFDLNIDDLLDGLDDIGAIDLSGFTDAFADNLFSSLWDSIKGYVMGATYGGLVGALVGFALGGLATGTLQGAMAGGKIGATIGAVVGTGIGAVWDTLSAEMQKAITNVAAGATYGTLLGGLLGFVIGAFATRTLQGALAGARIGAGIGSILGTTIGTFWEEIKGVFNDAIQALGGGAAATGTLIGAVLGMVIGAFALRSVAGALAGATIGASIGTLTGAWLSTFWDDITSLFMEKIESIKSIGAEAARGMLIGAITGMVIGAFIGAAAGGIGAIPGAWAGAKIGAAAGGIAYAIVEGLQQIDITGMLGDWLSGVGTFVMGVGEDLMTGLTYIGFLITTWASGVTTTIAEWTGNTIVSIALWLYDTKTSVADWVDTTMERIANWASTTKGNILTWATTTSARILDWYSGTKSSIESWVLETVAGFISFKDSSLASIQEFSVTALARIMAWLLTTKSNIGTWFGELTSALATWWHDLWNPGRWASGWSLVSSWFSSLYSAISSWFGSLANSVSSWWSGIMSSVRSGLSGLAATANGLLSGSSGNLTIHQYATGGIVNREQVAHIAEGNKAEAIIPLENESAMQPFVNAVTNGIVAGLGPILANSGAPSGGTSSELPPVYVGTLIADDRGLKELERRMRVIRVQEERRGNYA